LRTGGLSKSLSKDTVEAPAARGALFKKELRCNPKHAFARPASASILAGGLAVCRRSAKDPSERSDFAHS